MTRWTVDCLGYRVTVRCDSDLEPRLTPLLAHLPSPPSVAARRVDTLDVGRDRRPGYLVRSPSGEARRLASPGAVVDHVQAYVNRQVVDVVQAWSTGLHAAAAERDDVLVLLPGVSGAGKSTLVAGLVRAGWKYVTDEAVELHDDLRVRGFAKALTIDPGAQHLFYDLRPADQDTLSWYVPPHHLGTVADGRARAVDHVVVPRYEPAGHVSVARLPAAAGLMHLASCTFYFSNDGVRHLSRLAALVRRVPVWQVTYPDLGAGVRLLEQIAAGIATEGPA